MFILGLIVGLLISIFLALAVVYLQPDIARTKKVVASKFSQKAQIIRPTNTKDVLSMLGIKEE